jgi:post-segregation antitoxin (ccd killing protein)
MSNKISTCLYIDRGVLEAARQVGLNVSKVSENALVEAIGRLRNPKPEMSPINREPLRSEGRGRDLNPGARLHRPIGYQATSPRPLFGDFGYCFRVF